VIIIMAHFLADHRGASRAAIRWLAGCAGVILSLHLVVSPAPARQAGSSAGTTAGGEVAAATGTIAGTVRDAATGAPLAEINIIVRGTSRLALTDARGHYRLAGIPAGEHTLSAERIGIAPLQRTAVVQPGATVRLDFELAEVALELGDIVISVDREARRRAETPATISVLAGDAIRAAHAAHPSDLMAQVPGAWVNVTGGEGHMTAIRQPQTTSPVYLYLEDGVPTRSTGFFNHNALYEVNLPQADRIEVVKGPATALYGSDAIGATINIGGRAPSAEPSLEASLEGGAHGWGRLLLSASGTRGANGLRADLNLTRTNGWRDGTAYDRQAGTLRWDRELGAATSVKTVATFSVIDQATAGSSAVSRDDFRAHPTVNYTPISFRKVRALRLSSELRHVAPRSLFTLTAFARDNEMEILPNWSLAYDPTTYTNGHRSLGLMAKYRIDLEPLSTRLIAGVDLDHSPGHHLEKVVQPVRDGKIFTEYELGSTIYDYDVTFLGVSPYLQAEFAPVERLRLSAGLRYDRLGYDYTSRLAPLTTGPHRRPADTSVRYGHLSPKLGVTYEVAPELNLFASYGHGFRAPSEGQLFRQGQAAHTLGLSPVRADSYEGGVRGRVGTALRYELSAYRMVKLDDILSYTHPDGTRETVNAGRTLHRGLEAGLGVALPYQFQLDLSYAHSRHRYDNWQPRTGVDLGGNEMEQAPRNVASTVLRYEPRGPDGGAIALETRWIGSYWLDAENTARYEGHTLLGLRGELPVRGRVAIFGRVANLLDTRYAELASYTAARGEELAPGMPRAVYLGIQYR
jgi:outer membrane receptor protein involved in Fe transport